MRAARYVRYRWLLPAASYLPGHVLLMLDRYWKVGYDPADGWTFWMDVHFHQWARLVRRKNEA